MSEQIVNEVKMKPIYTIFEIIDEPESGFIKPIKESILIDVEEDSHDGTYPRISDWTRFANSIDSNGISAWLNRLSRNKTKIKMDGYQIIRRSKWDSDAEIIFDEPVNYCFGQVGSENIIRKVKHLKGVFTWESFFRKSGRQNKIANGIEIYFEIEKILA